MEFRVKVLRKVRKGKRELQAWQTPLRTAETTGFLNHPLNFRANLCPFGHRPEDHLPSRSSFRLDCTTRSLQKHIACDCVQI
jgi:hypothetical protein